MTNWEFLTVELATLSRRSVSLTLRAWVFHLAPTCPGAVVRALEGYGIVRPI